VKLSCANKQKTAVVKKEKADFMVIVFATVLIVQREKIRLRKPNKNTKVSRKKTDRKIQ